MNLTAQRYGKRGVGRVLACLFCLWVLLPGLALGAENASVQAGVSWYGLRIQAEPLTPGEAGYTGLVSVDGLCDGTNDKPLSNVTMTVGLTAPAAESGLAFLSVTVLDGDAAAVTIQPMDAAGAYTGEQKTLAAGRSAALPQGTARVLFCYYSGEKDIRQLPVGVHTGTVTLEIASLPEASFAADSDLGAVEASCTVETGEGGAPLELPAAAAPLALTGGTASVSPADTAQTAATATALPTASDTDIVTATAVPTAAPAATATAAPTAVPTAAPTATPAPVRLTCEARTRDGAPVAGASLTLTLADGHTWTLLTGKSGQAVFADIPRGRADLTVTPPQGAKVIALGDAQTTDASLVLSLDNDESLEILCTLSGGIAGNASLQAAGAQVALASPELQQNAAADENGDFAFADLPAGAYNVFVPLPAGAVLEDGSAWQVSQSGDMAWIAVTVEEGRVSQLPGVGFGSAASISGCAYVDGDGSLTRQDGEPLMTGVTVRLQRHVDSAWVDLETQLTNEFGMYTFEGLGEGEYRVCAQSDAVDYYAASVGGAAQYEGQAACGPTIALNAGERLEGATDIALQQPASLSFSAFVDANADGMRGPSDRGVMGVTVEVMDGDAPIAAGSTDGEGQVLVGGVRPGSYPLRVTLPAGYLFTVRGDSCVGDTAEKSALSDSFPFLPGQTASASAGAKPVGSFSGRVFEDLNNDGIMDESDPGVAGVVLHLERVKTGAVYELTTDDTGLYTFADLPDGTYLFSAILPQGMLYARYSRTGGDLRSVFSGSIVTREFKVSKAQQVTDKNVGVVQKGVLKGTAFLDLNYNGYLDEGEPGYAGVTLEAIKVSNNESMGKTVTDENGAFRLENLRGGDYRLRAVLPNDGSIFTMVPALLDKTANPFAQRAGRRENSVEPYTIISGGEAEALVGVAVGASVQGSVFLDADYNGSLNEGEKRLSGVTVEAVDAAGNVAASAKTNGEGKYALTGIMPGAYTIRFLRVSGYGFTRLRPEQAGGSHVVELLDGYGLTASMDIAMGQAVTDMNAGMLPSATVTGTLFNDLNDDGLLTEGERGLDSAKVRLVSQDGEIDWTRTVGEDGTYFFDGVMPGQYTLTYLLPEHVEIATVANGGNTLENKGRETVSPAFQVAMGESYQCPLVGAVVLGSFQGAVYKDSDADGARLDGDKGLPGATIVLTPDRKNLEEKTVQTDGNGSFALTDLRPASYRLTVTLPEGYIFARTAEGERLAFDAANTQTLSCPWSVLTDRREHLIGAVRPAIVSGVIWLDENRDGSRAKEEKLLDGISLELLDAGTGLTALRAVSTETGFLFDTVRPGTYTLRFKLPGQAQPAGDEASTFAPDGLYMVQRDVTVTEGQKLDGLTAGLVCQTSIGGTLSLREGDAASPVADVTVSLWLEGESAALTTTVSDEDGGYRFDGLWPGNYILRAELPQGMIFMRLGDPNYQGSATVIAVSDSREGTSQAFALKMAQHQLACDIIYIKPAKIGDQVWLDTNKNGLIDGGEPMIPGVKLALLAEGEKAYETVSDAYGYYLFDQVYPGTYTLRAEAYPELIVTTAVEGLRIISSCLVSGDGSGAESEPITVKSGEANMDCNAGYQLSDGQQQPAAIQTPPQRDWTESNIKFDGIQEQQR